MSLFLITNGPMPTTAAPAPVTTGASGIKTLLQFKPIQIARIVEWGISFDGFAAAAPIKVELLESDVAATVTASAEADICKLDDFGNILAATCMTLGTAGTGYTASAEGTSTVIRMLDLQLIAPSGQFLKQFPLGREPKIQAGKFARIRVSPNAAVNAYAYMVVEV